MDSLFLFVGLASQAPAAGLLIPGYTALAVGCLMAAVVAAGVNPSPLRHRWTWLLAPFLISIVILAYGAVFQFGGSPSQAPAWRVTGLWVLLSLHVPASLGLVAYFRRNPLVPVGLGVFQLWYSFCALLMSTMSVTNDWL